MPAPTPSVPPAADADMAARMARQREGFVREIYWRANLRVIRTLLGVWFAVSFLCGIVFVDTLNAFVLPGTSFPLGFWFAQQGAIYVFVVLIFVYAVWMNRIESKLGLGEG